MEKIKELNKNVLNWQENIFPYFNDSVVKSILSLPQSTLDKISEIRLRCMRAVSVTVGNKNIILKNIDTDRPLVLDEKEMYDIFIKLCQGSVYKFENQIRSGFITIAGGHRVGFCGSIVYDRDKVVTVNHISSLSFRVSRQIKNAAREIIGNLINDGKIYSALIVSEPCGGKTTILSDLSRLLSNAGYRCAVVDERGEICSTFCGTPQKDVGMLTDVLDGYGKGEGMMTALRSLSPQVIICDEVGTHSDAEAMLEAMNAGVPVIASAHARNEEELMSRPQIERLVDNGAIDKIFFLKGSAHPGVLKKIITVNNYDEDNWNSDDCY